MDRGRDFDNLLDMFDDIVGDVVGLFNGDGLVDGVDFLFNSDSSGVGGHSSLQGSGDSDFEVRDGGLQDVGGVARNVRGLSQVNLFGDDGGGLVDGGYVSFFGLGDMRGGH